MCVLGIFFFFYFLSLVGCYLPHLSCRNLKFVHVIIIQRTRSRAQTTCQNSEKVGESMKELNMEPFQTGIVTMLDGKGLCKLTVHKSCKEKNVAVFTGVYIPIVLSI